LRSAVLDGRRTGAYSSYVTRLAAVASWLINNNYTVLFFPTQIRADVLVIEDVKRILMKDPALDLETTSGGEGHLDSRRPGRQLCNSRHGRGQPVSRCTHIVPSQ